MTYGMLRTIVLWGAVAVGFSVLTPQCQAGPLLDWLFRIDRTANYAPATTAYYGDTAGCSTGCQTTCAPQVCQQVVVQYTPQTSYRTSWAQVPVTTYRPVTSTDPCTGCQVTCMKPCTSSSWQVRRVPYTTYRPVYSTVNVPVTPPVPNYGSGCSTCSSAAPAFGSGISTYSSAAPVVGSGCSTCSSAPSYSMPTTLSPIPAAAGTTYAPGSSIITPGPVPTGANGYTPQGLSPADQPPSLNPGGLPGSNFQGSNLRDYRPATRGASSNMLLETPSSPKAQPSNDPSVKPLPDPDAPANRLQPGDAPQLLNPRDRTASYPVRRAWSYSPVKFASATTVTESTDEAQPTSEQTPSQTVAPPAAERWDSTGWHSVR